MIESDRGMRLNPRYTDESCSSPRESQFDSSGVRIPISSPYDPFTNYLTPRPKFLRYDPDRRREILRRLEEATDGFGGMSIGSNSEGSIGEDSAKQEQEDSDSDGAGNEVEMRPICSLRWLCESLLLLLVLVLFMACFCYRSISSPPHNFENWHKSSSCRCGGFSDKIVEFVETDVSRKSISFPTDEVYHIEGRHANLSFTHEEAPEKIVESETDATQTDVDSLSGDIEEAGEWILINEAMKGSLLQENYQYDELDKTVEAQGGGVGKRVEDEPEQFSNMAETRVEKNDDLESNFYWIKKNSEPRQSAIAEPETGSKTENRLLQVTREVDKVTSAQIELVMIVVVYGSASAVLVFVLVLYSRRKKNLANNSSSPTKRHSFTVLPINCPRELAMKLERDDHLASDPVSSFPLENSPLLGSFTTTEMISTNRDHEIGEALISIATPVRRSRRIRDRAIRSRRHSNSMTSS